MELQSSNNDCPTLNTDSVTTLEPSDLPNNENNRIATEYSADDECSEPNGDKSTNVSQTRYRQESIIASDCRNVFRQIQNCNFSNLSRSDGEQKKEPAYPCACNPYEAMIEMKLRNLSISTNNNENPRLSDTSTCGLANKCEKWIENKFTDKYGRVFSEDLLFAVDVVMLLRNLNGLSFQYIIYPTTNSAPTSPCNKIIDKALAIIWNASAGEFTCQFDVEMKGKENYKNFQTFLMEKTRDWEREPFEAKGFLLHCAMIGQWTVCAESTGIKQATYFAPLTICRILHRLRMWRKITPTFWTILTEEAKEIVALYLKNL